MFLKPALCLRTSALYLKANMTLTTLVILYLCFRFKHLLCDWFLQSHWMAVSKGLPGNKGGYAALLSHAFIHGLGTLIITLIFAPDLWWLFLADILLHGLIDRIKARATLKYELGVKNKWYWWSLGVDQEAHNLTNLLFIILIYLHLSA